MSPMAKVDRPFHLRSVFELGSKAWGEDRFWNPTWIKFREAVTLPQAIEDPEEAAFRQQALARCLVAYASDVGKSVLRCSHQASTNRSEIQLASLDHSLWVHPALPPLMSGCSFISARRPHRALAAWCTQGFYRIRCFGGLNEPRGSAAQGRGGEPTAGLQVS